MAGVVAYERKGRIALIRVDNPPVNALSQAVRAGLDAAMEQFKEDDGAAAAVILGAGRSFIAGADLSEFGKPPQRPYLPDVINRIEAADKPVVAVLHGTALGGGLEVALGAHYRVALDGASVGLPEVTLGVVPGAGGTQRLPRLTGLAPALDIVSSARRVPAAEAAELGIVDALDAGDDPAAVGVAFAEALLDAGRGVRRVRDLPAPEVSEAVLDDWREKVAARAKGQIAPVTAIDAVAACARADFAEGLAEERRLFEHLRDSPQRDALVHAFFAERKVARLPELDGVAPREIARIGVIGGGTMGAGIAVAALLAGLEVTLIERDGEAAEAAAANVGKTLENSVARRKLSAAARDEILADRFRALTDYEALARADLVVEAVFESMEVKQEVFAKLDAVCRPGAVLATNTSYLDVGAIAASTLRPGDVIGLHFFSPAHVMKLVEVVVPEGAAPQAVATGFALAAKMRKIAVRSGVCDGFIGNRILSAYRAAADHMVLDGASPFDIDRAVVNFGFPMGPYAMSDLAGLDIGYMTRQRKAATRDPRERVPVHADRLFEMGRLGRKSGRGYYIYDAETPNGRPDPEVETMLAEIRAELGLTPRSFPGDEIRKRYIGAMVNEAARVVGEGIARRPLDVDVVLLHGYGFPRWRGGPMKHADQTGLYHILADIRALTQEDDFFWTPAPLLADLVAKGADFDSLN